MGFKKLLRSNWLARTMMVMWIITAVLVISMLINMDYIVHSTLYDYGLQFSSDWANPYWFYLRLSFAFLIVSTFLGISTFVLGFYKSKAMISETIAVAEKFVNQKTDVQTKPSEKKQKVKSKIERIDDTSKVISCPSCRKVFGRPMVMLNFQDGKTRLINVCPYCNQELGSAEDNAKPNTDFHIKGQEKTEFNHRIERT